MKIIQVIPFFGLGGAEIMCENLVYELDKMGHRVIVLSLYNVKTAITERLEAKGIDIRYLNKKNGLDFSLFKKLKKIFKAEKPDVIHTHLYTTKYVFPVATKLKIKVVHTVHSVASKEMSKISIKFNKFFYKHFNVVPVALSDAIKDTIITEYKLDSKKVPTILNGIDLSRCKNKSAYDFFNKSFRIVHIGSFSEVKNHKGLVEAFEIFNKKYSNSELHLIGDGKLKKEIETLVFEKNLSDKVVFHGSQPDVHMFLSDMDLFTLPSLYEGVPMSLIEAMGTGLPIVATRVGGIPDMLDDESSILTDLDCFQIADAFEKFYINKDIRIKKGMKALELSQKFSSYYMALKYCEVYKA